MRIIHVYKSYYPDTLGGVEKSIAEISAVTAKLGCHNRLLTTSASTQTLIQRQFPGLTTHYFPQTFALSSCPLSWQALKQFKTLANDADIIHYHFPWPFADFMHYCRHIKKPSILTYHSDIIRQRFLKYAYQPLMHAFLKQIDCIVPTSPNLLQTSPLLQKFAPKCHVIPLGINSSMYQNKNKPKQIPKHKIELGVFGKKFFLFLGVLRYYKGLNILIDAVKNTDIPIVIAGDGPEKHTLMAQAKKYNCNNIHFLGKVSEANKIALLQTCRAVVLPSHLRSEAFGISLLEGLLFSKPLISTELGTGTSYVNQHGTTGLVVKPKDSQALRNALIQLYEDDQIVNSMSIHAKTRFTQLFHSDVIGEQYFQQYKRLLQK